MPTAQPKLIHLARRCWIDEDVADQLTARCAVALETSAAYTVVASLTAARAQGMWLSDELPDRVHLATATPDRPGRQMTRTRRPQFVAHRFQLSSEDLVQVNGLTMTSMARTWCDLAAVLSLPDLVAAGDSIVGRTTADGLAAAVARMGRRSGTRRARAALALLDGRSRSRPESHLRVAISSPDLPRFEVNEPIFRDEGGWLAEPDLSLAAKLALEYQGADHAEVSRMRRDLTRFADIRRSGWLPLAYGPAEVFGRPWEIRSEVRAAVRERAPHLLLPAHPAGRGRAQPAVVSCSMSGHSQVTTRWAN